MELIAAALIAGPLGYLVARRGLAFYIVLWAIVLPRSKRSSSTPRTPTTSASPTSSSTRRSSRSASA